MGKQTRAVPRERMSQVRLNSLIVKKDIIEREPVDPRPLLFSDLDYDSLHPEEEIKNFCISIRNMLSRYQYNKDRYVELEQEMQDILHYIEMGTNKNANVGYKLYKKLADIRRERRICKNEAELLQPIYDAFGGGQTLNNLSQIQGACHTAKQAISNRAYSVRTDTLSSFIDDSFPEVPELEEI